MTDQQNKLQLGLDIAEELAKFYGDIPEEHVAMIQELIVEEVIMDVLTDGIRVQDVRTIMMKLYHEAIRYGDIPAPTERFEL